jgi:hypothetical protein
MDRRERDAWRSRISRALAELRGDIVADLSSLAADQPPVASGLVDVAGHRQLELAYVHFAACDLRAGRQHRG